MPRRLPLPPTLQGGAFTTHFAQENGVSERRLRGGDLARPFHGIRSTVPVTTILHLAHSFQLRMPASAFFCGITAALIIGLPLPLRLQKLPGLHVGVPAPQRAPRSAGIIGHKLQVNDDDVIRWGRLRITAVARTWCDLASVLDVEDLVAAGDYNIHFRHPLASQHELEEAIALYPGRRALPRLVEALALLNDRAESAPESIIRVTIVRAGINGLVANHPIYNVRGTFIARADLCFPAHRVIFEYQGDYHRTEAGRWRKDRTRIARLAAAGWHVIEIAADELLDRATLLELIRDTLALYPPVFA